MRNVPFLYVFLALALMLSSSPLVHGQDKAFTRQQLKTPVLKQRLDTYLQDNTSQSSVESRKLLAPLVDLNTENLTYSPDALSWIVPAKKTLSPVETQAANKELGDIVFDVLGQYKGGLLTPVEFKLFAKQAKVKIGVIQPKEPQPKDEVAKRLQELENAMEKKLDALEKRFQLADAANKKQIQALENALQKSNKQIVLLATALKQANTQIGNLGDALKDANAQIAAQGEALKAAHIQIANLGNSVKEANKVIDLLANDAKQTKQTLGKVKDDLQTLTNYVILGPCAYVPAPIYDPCRRCWVSPPCYAPPPCFAPAPVYGPPVVHPQILVALEKQTAATRTEVAGLKKSDQKLTKRLDLADLDVAAVQKQVMGMEKENRVLFKYLQLTQQQITRLDGGLHQALKAREQIALLVKGKQAGGNNDEIMQRLRHVEKYLGELDSGLQNAVLAKSGINTNVQETLEQYRRDKLLLTNRLNLTDRYLSQMREEMQQVVKNRTDLAKRLSASEATMQAMQKELKESQATTQALASRMQITEKYIGKMDSVVQQALTTRSDLERIVQKKVDQSQSGTESVARRLGVAERYIRKLEGELKEIQAVKTELQRRLTRTESTLNGLVEISSIFTSDFSMLAVPGQASAKE